MDNYEYGFNLEKDINELYKGNIVKNEERIALFSELTTLSKDIRRLGSLIQNPVPIKYSSLEHWIFTKKIYLNHLEELLERIQIFAHNNHII